MPSCKRIHAAIGKDRTASIAEEIFSSDGRGSAKTGKLSKILGTRTPADFPTGLIMSMHLFSGTPAESWSSPDSSTQLQLLCAYESGTVTQWRFFAKDKLTSVEGIGWEAVWTVKLHVETGMHSRTSHLVCASY